MNNFLHIYNILKVYIKDGYEPCKKYIYDNRFSSCEDHFSTELIRMIKDKNINNSD